MEVVIERELGLIQMIIDTIIVCIIIIATMIVQHQILLAITQVRASSSSLQYQINIV